MNSHTSSTQLLFCQFVSPDNTTMTIETGSYNIKKREFKFNISKRLVAEDMLDLCLFLKKSHPKITSLDLSNQEIGDNGVFKALALAALRTGLSLISLKLNFYYSSPSYNRITIEDIKALGKAFPLLEKIDISRNIITIEDIQTLKKAFPQLKELIMSSASIDQEAAKTLAHSFPQLERLNVENNQIGVGGVRAFSTMQYLKKLNLNNNFIGGNMAAKAFAANTSLKEINVTEGNFFSKEDYRILNETNPTTLTNFARQENPAYRDIPSLLKISLFAVENYLKNKNPLLTKRKTLKDLPQELLDSINNPSVKKIG